MAIDQHKGGPPEVLDSEHSFMRPTNRGKDRTVERDETERVDRESCNRDGNGPLHDQRSRRWYRIHAERGSRDTE
jgi:hypothetical protein